MTSFKSTIKEYEMPYYDPGFPEYSAIMRCYDLSEFMRCNFDLSEDDYSDSLFNALGCEAIRDGHDCHGSYMLIGFFPTRGYCFPD
jgi:hypothetical protein